jgi:hypothetical protein
MSQFIPRQGLADIGIIDLRKLIFEIEEVS